MIRAAGLGVAVGNAHPALKDAANLVTAGQYGAGVLEALKAVHMVTLWLYAAVQGRFMRSMGREPGPWRMVWSMSGLVCKGSSLKERK